MEGINEKINRCPIINYKRLFKPRRIGRPMKSVKKIIISDYKGKQSVIDSHHWIVVHKCSCGNTDAEFVLYYQNKETNDYGWVCQRCMGLIKKDNESN